MSKLEMQQCVLGQVFTNCYFLKNKETGELLIVDPGDYAEKVFQKVSLMQGKPVGILLTHGHFDHIMAVKKVKEKYQIPVYACRQEEAMLAEPTINMTAVYGSGRIFHPDVPHTGTYQRKLLLLYQRRRCAFQRRYIVLRLCGKNRFSWRKFC